MFDYIKPTKSNLGLTGWSLEQLEGLKPLGHHGDLGGPVVQRERQDGGLRGGDDQSLQVTAPRSWLPHTSAATGSSAVSTSWAPPSMMPSKGEASSAPMLTGRRGQAVSPSASSAHPAASRIPSRTVQPIPRAHDDIA